MSSQTYYKERLGSFDVRDHDTNMDGDKQAYEESLTKFKGWSWDLWTFFINIVGMATQVSFQVSLELPWSDPCGLVVFLVISICNLIISFHNIYGA